MATTKRRQNKRKVPDWDAKNGQLWLRKVLLMHFDHAAPAQYLVLDAFQRQGWPSRIDNPFKGGRNAKERCRRTVENLIRGLKGSISSATTTRE